MADIENLLEAFESGALVRPDSDTPNFVDLALASAKLSGAPDVEETPNSIEIRNRIGDTDHLVFVLLDGVGMNLVESMSRSSFLRSHLTQELQAVYPSTTSVALTSLATCQWPATHAVTGWWTHIEEIGSSAVVLQFASRSDSSDLGKLGVDLESVFPVPSAMAQFGRDTLIIVAANIADSPYSRYFGGGQKTYGYGSLEQGVTKTIQRVHDASEPTFTYLYISQVDSLAHLHGITRPEVKHALNEVDNEMARLAAGVGGKARVIMTADHGLLDAPPGARHTLRLNRQLNPLLRYPPSGDARIMYLHTRDWAAERVRRLFERRFGDRFILITVDEAESLKLFGPGPLSPKTRERMGDLIAISSGDDMIEYNAARGVGKSVQLNSHHSGLTPEEMEIPLVIV
ncbi:MAG: alkaline phosphatase family protein [Chloroflexi bacterium]|nr:alkaline phosphatase family protein [Chloroflexota bacterium]